MSFRALTVWLHSDTRDFEMYTTVYRYNEWSTQEASFIDYKLTISNLLILYRKKLSHGSV